MVSLWVKLRCKKGDGELSPSASDTTDGRAQWGHTIEFFLSCVGYCFGLGNIWRFPYMCYRNGGGAFLIPYVIFLFLCAIPLMLLEMSIGQYAGAGPLGCWSICPLAKGLGMSMMILSVLCCVYYNVIMTWALYFLFHSFKDPLPWAQCNNSWNSPECRPLGYKENSTIHNSTIPQNMTFSKQVGQLSAISDLNSNLSQASRLRHPYPAEEFWIYKVLSLSSGIDELIAVRWDLALTLMLAWIIVFLCLIKGIKSSGKVVYVSATAPYILLTVLLIKGAMMDGSLEGIKFFLIPQFSKLATPSVWAEACGQIFYSTAIGWGAWLTMSSYNKFNTNIYRYAMTIPFIDIGTSVYAGFVIFSVIGFMAKQADVPVDRVIDSGPGLIFVAYPYAISQLPLPQLWAVLFFVMIFAIGIDSQFGTFETFTTAIFDEFPGFFDKHWKKTLFTASTCIAAYFGGLICVTHAGMYYFQLMDWYLSIFTLLLIALLECIVIAWVYGADRFYEDIQLMIGYQPMLVFKFMWRFVTPIVTAMLFLFSLATYEAPVYNKVYVYPTAAIVVFWIYGLSSSVPLPAYAFYLLWKSRNDGTPFLQRLRKYLKPSKEWHAIRLQHEAEKVEGGGTELKEESIEGKL